MFCDGNEAEAFICAGHMGGHMGRHRKSCGAHGKSRVRKKRVGTWPETGRNISRHATKHMNGNRPLVVTAGLLIMGINSFALRSRLLSGSLT